MNERRFRAPDHMRFCVTPFNVREADNDGSVEVLARVMRDRLWDATEYKERPRVT